MSVSHCSQSLAHAQSAAAKSYLSTSLPHRNLSLSFAHIFFLWLCIVFIFVIVHCLFKLVHLLKRPVFCYTILLASYSWLTCLLSLQAFFVSIFFLECLECFWFKFLPDIYSFVICSDDILQRMSFGRAAVWLCHWVVCVFVWPASCLHTIPYCTIPGITIPGIIILYCTNPLPLSMFSAQGCVPDIWECIEKYCP